MHYTGMAAVQAHAAPGLVASTADTASATGFLLPLILGLCGIGFIFSAVIALSPTAAEIVEEGELMKRIGQSQAAYSQAIRPEARPWQAPPPQPYQASREEPGPDAPGSLFRPRRPSRSSQRSAQRSAQHIGAEISGDLTGATSQPDVIVEPGAERPGRSEK